MSESYVYRCTFVQEVGIDHQPVAIFQDEDATQAAAIIRDMLKSDWEGSEGHYEEMLAVQNQRLEELEQGPKWGLVIPTFYGSYAVTV